jgi:hypothetical protein
MRPPHLRSFRLRSFRKSLTWAGVILFGLAVAARAMAEVSTPQVADSSINHAGFSAVPQHQERPSLDWFLANHDPSIAEMKVRSLGLLYEGNWRSQVPALQPYLAQHLYEWQELDGQKPVQRSTDLASSKVYSLFDVKLAAEPILYGNQVNYLPLKPWLADDESLTREVGHAASPLWQLEFGSWRLLVMLSGAAISQ